MAASSEAASALTLGGIPVDPDFPVEIKWIGPRLAFGSMIGTMRNMSAVAAAGVTHVINLQAEIDDSALVGDTGIRVHWLKLGNDMSGEPIDSALEFAEAALRSPDNYLFIHCLAGRTRSALLAFAVLLLLGSAKADARAQILRADPDAAFDDEMLRIVSRSVERYRS